MLEPAGNWWADGEARVWNAQLRLPDESSVQIYFCDPKNPWQRGSNENTMVCCATISPRALNSRETPQAQLNAAARELNERPRRTLGGM